MNNCHLVQSLLSTATITLKTLDIHNLTQTHIYIFIRYKTIHRYLILWADHASILSAGFLLLTVKVVYDKDIFYTDEELLKTTGFPYDVQELVEEPFIYVLGHTSDSIAEKLSKHDLKI